MDIILSWRMCLWFVKVINNISDCIYGCVQKLELQLPHFQDHDVVRDGVTAYRYTNRERSEPRCVLCFPTSQNVLAVLLRAMSGITEYNA